MIKSEKAKWNANQFKANHDVKFPKAGCGQSSNLGLDNLDEKLKFLNLNTKLKEKIKKLEKQRSEFLSAIPQQVHKTPKELQHSIPNDTVKARGSDKGEIIVWENGTNRGNEDMDDTIKLIYIMENDIM
jgi:hypothetical protein